VSLEEAGGGIAWRGGGGAEQQPSAGLTTGGASTTDSWTSLLIYALALSHLSLALFNPLQIPNTRQIYAHHHVVEAGKQE